MVDSQQPPENPFEVDDGIIDQMNGGEQPKEDLPEGVPDVASKAGKAFVVMGIVGAGVLFLLYSIFLGGDKPAELDKPKKITVAPKPAELPPLPVLEPTLALEPPPVDIVAPSLPEPIDMSNIPGMDGGGGIGPNGEPLDPKAEAAAQEQIKARLRSNMMIKDGGSGEGSGLGSVLGGSTPPAGTLDSNAQFARNAASTQVETVAATRMKGQLNRTIGQGRIIQATMESALNTDLSAPIRAIVSRDTYGEAGNIPLIPKGSRLIGTYNTSLTSGQTRVLVIWNRVIRPDGVDVMLGSPLVDAIGRAGVSGQIDTKFQEIFSRSLVSSAMNIALAIGSEKITGGTTTTTNSPDGGSQTSGDAATTATTAALDRLGAVSEGFISKFLNVPPTILVDQGTIVNVFVNKDIVFPGDTATGSRMID